MLLDRMLLSRTTSSILVFLGMMGLVLSLGTHLQAKQLGTTTVTTSGTELQKNNICKAKPCNQLKEIVNLASCPLDDDGNITVPCTFHRSAGGLDDYETKDKKACYVIMPPQVQSCTGFCKGYPKFPCSTPQTNVCVIPKD